MLLGERVVEWQKEKQGEYRVEKVAEWEMLSL